MRLPQQRTHLWRRPSVIGTTHLQSDFFDPSDPPRVKVDTTLDFPVHVAARRAELKNARVVEAHREREALERRDALADSRDRRIVLAMQFIPFHDT